MPQEWQQSSAAREQSYDQPNPFAPVDYVQRLQRPHRSRSAQAQQAYQPGQLYGQPPVSSAPPSAAPQFDPPAYLPVQPYAPAPPPAAYPESVQPGAPYPAQGFGHQPSARMPDFSTADVYAAQQSDEIAAFFAEPWYEDAPVQQEAPQPEEPVLRDAFEPAAPEKQPPARPAAEEKPSGPPGRPRIRYGRLAALVAAFAMLLFCFAALGRIIWDLVSAEKTFEQARSAYQEQTGEDLREAGARVELLPAGQTYEPTHTPAPTQFIPTPAPTPVFAIHAPSSAHLAAAAGVEATPSPAPTAVQRTRLTTYPDNPLCNVMESLKEDRDVNPDVVGHLVIEGVLDEVVVHRNNTYYLTHNAYGLSSAAGAVFMDESCSLRMPPENLLLRGQGSVPGKVFEPLWQYVSKGSAFVASAATATLTTLYDEEKYVLFAVIAADSDPASVNYFNYASHPTFDTDESMMAYVASARSHSLYPFDTDVVPGDRLLTLATVSGDSAVVLMYRMARPGEGY